jgi:riboflavin kinase
VSKEMIVKGKIISGINRGKYFVEFPWVKKQINEKLGFTPYNGTLNLKVSDQQDLQRIREANGIRIYPQEGYCEAKIFKAFIFNRILGAVVVPSVTDYPPDQLELIAPVNLRDHFKLKDDELVNICITIE